MIEIKIDDMHKGFFYYARYKNDGKNLICGKFECIVQPGPVKFARFTETISTDGICLPYLRLCDRNFTFYQKNIEIMVYTNVVLRKITGDPDFIYYKFPINFTKTSNLD